MWQGHLRIFLRQGGQDGGPEHLNPLNPKSGQHPFSSNNIKYINMRKIYQRPSVILLQIVMVSPGTHLEKYHESLSRTNESQFKNKDSLGLYVTTQLI